MVRGKKTTYRRAGFKAGRPREERRFLSLEELKAQRQAPPLPPPQPLPPAIEDVHKWPAIGEQPKPPPAGAEEADQDLPDNPAAEAEEPIIDPPAEADQSASSEMAGQGAFPHNAPSSQQLLVQAEEAPAIEHTMIVFGSFDRNNWQDDGILDPHNAPSSQQLLGHHTDSRAEAENAPAIEQEQVFGAEASASEQIEDIPEWDEPNDAVPWDFQATLPWQQFLGEDPEEEAQNLTEITSESVDSCDWYDDVIKDSQTTVSRKEFSDNVESALYGQSRFLSSFSFYPCILIHVFYGLKDLLLKSIGLHMLPYQPMKTVPLDLNLALLALPLNMMVMDIYCMMAFRKFEQGKKMKRSQKWL